MGTRSVLFFTVCWAWIAVFFSPVVHGENCVYFLEDFSGGNGRSWSFFSGSWVLQNGGLSVLQVPSGGMAGVETAFYADDLYQIDVDLDVLDATGDAGFGIYTLTSGDTFLDVGGETTDGIGAMVYPGQGKAALTARDVLSGEWFDSNFVSVSEPITSIGFTLSDDQAVLRLNRQNTAAVFSGSFTFAPWVVNTLWLMARGTSAQAKFDNVCADVPGSGPPPTSDVYDGIWKNADQSMNFYIQTYETGSALVIATADLQNFQVFLDPDFSDGVDTDDLAGGGHHLTLSFSSSDQASAVLTLSGSGARNLSISKSFGTPSVSTHDGIWKSPDCQAGTMNYYLQSYAAGSGIAIVTSDLSTFYVFLDPDLSDGMDVSDLAGKGAHLTLSLSTGQTTAMARCFAAPYDADGGSPAASCSLTGTGGNPGVVLGPGGSSIDLADEMTPGKTVTLSSADASEVVESGETSVSGAVRISVSGGEEPLSGNGFFKVSLPVTGDVADPAHLTMKTKLTTGLVLPVYGEYDATSKTYSADVAQLYNGWVFGVVTQPDQEVYTDTGGMTPAAWQTEFDWKTFAWNVVDPSNTLTEVNAREIQAAAGSASTTLSNALFRAPKLWVSTATNPHARLIHNVAGKIKFWQPGTEENANYTTVSKTEQEMLALGRLYLDYNAIKTSLAPKGITLAHVVIHELFHSVQAGYDIRVAWDNTTHSLKPYYEGTAAPLGQSYQDNNGSITGPSAVVRNIVGGGDEYAILNRAVDDYTARGENKDFYSKQDFFVYVTRMYNQNDWSYTGSLFQDMYSATYNKFGLSMAQYRNLYRTALSNWIAFWTSKSLSEVYFNYALDRAYKHPSEAIFRASENFTANKLADTLFTADTGIKTVDADNKFALFESIEPLSAYAVKIPVPTGYQTDEDSTLELKIGIENGELKDEGLRIVLFRENKDRVMVAEEGELRITDITEPIPVTVNKDVTNLTLLIANCYVDDKTVKVAVALAERPLIIECDLELKNTSGGEECVGESANLEWNCTEDECKKYEGLVWSGTQFSYRLEIQGELLLRIEGEVSADESSLVSFEYETYLFPTRLWAYGVPLVSRTEDGLVYEVTGAEVPEYVSAESYGWFDACKEDTIIVDENTFFRITVPR